MEKLEEITKEIRERGATLSPHEMSEMRLILAGEYSYAMEQLTEILSRKPAVWNEIRKGVGSDKAAEREYESTKDGIKEMELRFRTKRIERLSSSLSSALRLAEWDFRNNTA